MRISCIWHAKDVLIAFTAHCTVSETCLSVVTLVHQAHITVTIKAHDSCTTPFYFYNIFGFC